MSDASQDSAPPSDETPREAARRSALAHCASLREALQKGRALPPLPPEESPDWDLHERRLDEIEELIRTRNQPEGAVRLGEMQEDFLLDFQADMARLAEGLNRRMVRFFDDVAVRVEEKKFELPSADRDQMEDLLLPYYEGIREEMLGQLPIATRRKLEEQKRRREEDGPAPKEAS